MSILCNGCLILASDFCFVTEISNGANWKVICMPVMNNTTIVGKYSPGGERNRNKDSKDKEAGVIWLLTEIIVLSKTKVSSEARRVYTDTIVVWGALYKVHLKLINLLNCSDMGQASSGMLWLAIENSHHPLLLDI